MSVQLDAAAIRSLGRAIANGSGYTFPGSFGGGGSLATLTDVTLTNVQDGDLLAYDANQLKWVNGGVIDLGGPF